MDMNDIVKECGKFRFNSSNLLNRLSKIYLPLLFVIVTVILFAHGCKSKQQKPFAQKNTDDMNIKSHSIKAKKGNTSGKAVQNSKNKKTNSSPKNRTYQIRKYNLSLMLKRGIIPTKIDEYGAWSMVTFDLTGNHLVATYSSNNAYAWNVANWQLTRKYTRLKNPLHALAVGDDGLSFNRNWSGRTVSRNHSRLALG